MCGTKKYAHKKQESVTSICKDNLVVRWKAAERCVEAENQLVLANVNLDKVSISELFKIGVDLNGMSASEYLPLCQSFTNRTHIRNGRRFDQSEISQIIEKNICCGVILSDFDTIKKYTSNGIYRVTV